MISPFDPQILYEEGFQSRFIHNACLRQVKLLGAINIASYLVVY